MNSCCEITRLFELRRIAVTINVFVSSMLSGSLLALAYLVTSDNACMIPRRKLTHCMITVIEATQEFRTHIKPDKLVS